MSGANRKKGKEDGEIRLRKILTLNSSRKSLLSSAIRRLISSSNLSTGRGGYFLLVLGDLASNGMLWGSASNTGEERHLHLGANGTWRPGLKVWLPIYNPTCPLQQRSTTLDLNVSNRGGGGEGRGWGCGHSKMSAGLVLNASTQMKSHFQELPGIAGVRPCSISLGRPVSYPQNYHRKSLHDSKRTTWSPTQEVPILPQYPMHMVWQDRKRNDKKIATTLMQAAQCYQQFMTINLATSPSSG